MYWQRYNVLSVSNIYVITSAVVCNWNLLCQSNRGVIKERYVAITLIHRYLHNNIVHHITL